MGKHLKRLTKVTSVISTNQAKNEHGKTHLDVMGFLVNILVYIDNITYCFIIILILIENKKL